MIKITKKIKMTATIIILLALLLTGVGIYVQKAGLWPLIVDFVYTPKVLLQLRRVPELELEQLRAIDNLLTPEELAEDLEHLKKDILQVHPKAAEGLTNDLEIAFNQAITKINEPLMVIEFHAVISEILSNLGDAHTTSRLQTPRLPIEFKIIGDDFYVLPYSAFNVQLGDKLISVGGVTIKDLFEINTSKIAAENIYWYNHLFETTALSLTSLIQAGAQVDNGCVEVVFERDGQFFQLPMEFTQYPHQHNENFKYKIVREESYVHFILKACEYSDSYKNFLALLFEDIKSNEIEHFILDLRGNVGGNVAVINEFLRYIPVENYSTFDRVTVRLSPQASKQRGYLGNKGLYKMPISKEIANSHIDDLLFEGQIYVLIDNQTFSAATTFATVLSDNGLASIVGQPTGGMPTCYGDALYFQLPNSKLQYSISHKKFERVNEEKRYEKSLYPDYPVYYSLDDFFERRDLELQKVMELIQNK